MKRRIRLAVLFAVVLGVHPVFPAEDELRARCIEVRDGDTLVVEARERVFILDIRGIDAPELGQEFGEEARDYLSSIALNRGLKLSNVSGENSSTLTAAISADGLDLAEAMLQQGLAWHDTIRDSQEKLVLDQLKARSSGLGLWEQKKPIPPWKWRSVQTPTPTPLPARHTRLSEVASMYRLEKNRGSRTVIHQPPPSRKNETSSVRKKSSGQVGNSNPFGGPQCCCELSGGSMSDKSATPETFYRMIDAYSCENAVAIVDNNKNLVMSPEGCVADSYCNQD